MIYRFQPFATDKTKFGEVYNAHCNAVPNNEDWIQLMDWDAQILIPETYQVIDRAIERYPDTEIFGAMTNRIGYQWQRYTTWQDPHMDMLHHVSKAAHALQWKDGECKVAPSIAGFFMLFKKSYWERNKFQTHIINENGRAFDKQFCQGATRMRIILGVYIFHQYRINKNWRDNKHLLTEQPNNFPDTPQS
jgi:hypothetical protein